MNVAAAKTIHDIVRNTRRLRGLTQAELALEVGCKQSAVSMFEAGRQGALSDETVARMAEMLEIDIAELPSSTMQRAGRLVATTLKYCPVDECPSNVPYVVHGHLLMKPSLVSAPRGELTRCADCGEILESRCPNPDCGADLADGTFCSKCGTPYVTVLEREREQLTEWADVQRARIKDIRALSKTRKSG